jgi:hypothetical protein
MPRGRPPRGKLLCNDARLQDVWRSAVAAILRGNRTSGEAVLDKPSLPGEPFGMLHAAIIRRWRAVRIGLQKARNFGAKGAVTVAQFQIHDCPSALLGCLIAEPIVSQNTSAYKRSPKVNAFGRGRRGWLQRHAQVWMRH